MTTTPCEQCPVITWAAITSTPDSERTIRADQRRLDIRELQAAAKDLVWLVNQLAGADTAHKTTGDAVEQVRRFARRLADALEVGVERMNEGDAA